jgi:hypothetical protein
VSGLRLFSGRGENGSRMNGGGQLGINSYDRAASPRYAITTATTTTASTVTPTVCVQMSVVFSSSLLLFAASAV